ncbi:uncharacterized protein [Antennarius striatus]|uniref:uncharacterized protein n=1 Tax=Antennarius striatus TaxID=241820 RepID=UPI0035AEB396
MWMLIEDVTTSCPGLVADWMNGQKQKEQQKKQEELSRLKDKMGNLLQTKLQMNKKRIVQELSTCTCVGSLVGVFKETNALSLLMEQKTQRSAIEMLRDLASYDAAIHVQAASSGGRTVRAGNWRAAVNRKCLHQAGSGCVLQTLSMSLQDLAGDLNDLDHRNWFKACCCLDFLRNGLRRFMDPVLRDFHRDLMKANSRLRMRCNGRCRPRGTEVSPVVTSTRSRVVTEPNRFSLVPVPSSPQRMFHMVFENSGSESACERGTGVTPGSDDVKARRDAGRVSFHQRSGGHRRRRRRSGIKRRKMMKRSHPEEMGFSCRKAKRKPSLLTALLHLLTNCKCFNPEDPAGVRQWNTVVHRCWVQVTDQWMGQYRAALRNLVEQFSNDPHMVAVGEKIEKSGGSVSYPRSPDKATKKRWCWGNSGEQNGEAQGESMWRRQIQAANTGLSGRVAAVKMSVSSKEWVGAGDGRKPERRQGKRPGL